jgi:hypothetical protein
MISFRGRAELADSRPHLFDLADALKKCIKEKGAFPRGALPRNTSGDHIVEWRPDQRLSWTVEMLQYLGAGEYGNLRPDKEKSWSEPPNALLARMPVPYFLSPTPQGGTLNYQVPYPGHASAFAATHWVGMAGVGLDAASYKADDPAVADKIGIFGYDRVTKVQDVKDGLDKTIALIMVPPETAGPWIAGGGSTVRGVSEEPDCVQPFVCAEHNKQRGTFAIMGNGDLRFIPQSIDPELFRALCTMAANDKIRELNRYAPLVARPEAGESQDPKKPAPPAARSEPAPPPRPAEVPKADPKAAPK